MASSKNKDRVGIVYSTKEDFKFVTNKPPEPNFFPFEKQNLKIYLDTKLKAGKKTTIISGFIGKKIDFELLSKQIKNKCGAGGSVKDDLIIIQGDFKSKIFEFLTQSGYRTKTI